MAGHQRIPKCCGKHASLAILLAAVTGEAIARADTATRDDYTLAPPPAGAGGDGEQGGPS